ncbi:ABC transporter ATP-binding protein [Micropruina sp.]|uniref:ABC transporter ATP-binding protein n=1 Tax=Micropruina sp. TaxID=2737536 RepID=UPI0039E55AAD
MSRRFGDLDVLHPTDLIINAGDYLAVTGPSGSGKSTLLNVVGLLDRPTAGSVRVAGQSVDGIADHLRSAIRGSTIGFIFQAFHLLGSRTATENVELGMMYRSIPRAERRNRARSALARVGLEHRMNARPATLSGGERQRVAIARALASDVQLLLADEPTGNLDSATGDRILALFEELHTDGLTLVVVTHSPEVARRAERRLVMMDGILME